MLPVGHRARRLPATESLRPVDGSARALPRPPAASHAGSELGPPAPLISITPHLRPEAVTLVQLLQRRQTSSLRATVDLAITPSGVWVVHTRAGRGAVAARKPMRGAATLTISGRDRSDLVTDLGRQRESVAGALLALGRTVPVRSAICFSEATRPPMRLADVGVDLCFGQSELDARLRVPGVCDGALVAQVTALLDATFPAA